MRTLIKVLILGLAAMLLAGCLVSLPGTGGNTMPPPPGAALAEHVAGEVLVRPLEGRRRQRHR